jgi:hypothetical protein
MKCQAWILSAAIALLASQATLAQKKSPPPKDCTSPQRLGSVDLTVERNLLVPITLNGRKAAMRLNTATGFGWIAANVVADFGLAESNAPFGHGLTVGSYKVKKLAAFDSLYVGDLEFRKSKMIVGPTARLQESAIGPVIGVIGMNFFVATDFELDLARRKLVVYSQEHCPGNVVHWADSHLTVPLYRNIMGGLYFPLELDAQKVEATIDTDSPVSTLTRDIATRLFGVAGGEDAAKEFHAMTLTAAGLEAEEVQMRLINGHKECRYEVAMVRRTRAAGYNCTGLFPVNLGRDVLSDLHLYFATRENVLYFTRADATKVPPQ